MADELSDLLRKHAHLFDNQAAYAKALGIDVGRLNRLMNRKGPYSLNATNCLRFARLTGELPSEILRAAGKGELADLIEALYGKSDITVTPAERKHLKQWHALSQHRREILQDAIDELLGEPDTQTQTGRKRKPA